MIEPLITPLRLPLSVVVTLGIIMCLVVESPAFPKSAADLEIVIPTPI